MLLLNRNTTQNPLAAQGKTGPQSIKFIPAPRVYVAPPVLTIPAPVEFGLSNGNSPWAFQDLGVVDGSAKVVITQTTNPAYIGIDKLLVAVYQTSQRAEISFSLSQLDDFVFEQVSGAVLHSTVPGQYTRYLLGGQSFISLSLLLVMQNKLDGKEWQFYNPAALLNFSFDNATDASKASVTGILPAFTGANSTSPNQIMSCTILGGEIPGYGYRGYGESYGN